MNFKSRNACRRCSASRPTSAPNTNNPQNFSKPGDWKCQSCGDLNFAARIACRKCGVAKVQPMEVDRPPVVVKPGDWKCGSCPEMNFGSRVVCRSCGVARPTTASASTPTNKTDECVICMENRIDSVFSSCGHSAVCMPCGALITQCPMCRKDFSREHLIKMFNAH